MKNFNPLYNQLNKAELHCHLEGAIRTTTLIDIARQHNLPLPADTPDTLNPFVKVYDQFKDLQSVLDAFSIAQNSIVSPAVVERIAAELFEDAAAQHIRLLEVRFSPDWAFRGHNLDWDACLEAILRASQAAQQRYDMAIGLIAITSRSLGVESCQKTVDWAIRWKDHIQGIDLADAELQHPISEFVRPVLQARDAGLKITVHTGEDTPAVFVKDTILAVHPERIGHGIQIINDPKVIELVIRNDITLEVNPWSNYLTNSVRFIEEHPLKLLFDLGVKVTINSDDPEVLDTNLNNEYRIAHEVLGMSLEDVAACNCYALNASFLPEPPLQTLMDKYFSPPS